MTLAALLGCSSSDPLPTVDRVDLPQFMGDWYVVGHIPASVEEDAYNAVETYEIAEDGRIATTYVFRKGGFEGELEELTPVATVKDRETNATWGMQFVWPFKAEYLITYLDDDYQSTIIGRTKRDYVWLMTREPDVDDASYQALVDEAARHGYDPSLIRRVPHRWPDAGHPVDR